MTFSDSLKQDVAGVLAYGDQVRFKYYNLFSSDNDYDDAVTYTQSGADFWTSGLSQPIDNHPNGVDAVLLEQGKIKLDDRKLYVNDVVQTSGLAPIKIGIGSPVINEYEILNQGQTIEWSANGEPIYKKIYCKFLTAGSFIENE